MARCRALTFSALLLLGAVSIAGAAVGGTSNPDISAIGQLVANRTDDASSDHCGSTVLSLGETELVLDSYLNPYARGFFVFSIGDDGLETEEAYITIFKGLPGGVALKGGKYRLGFGKLNPAHPHTYPFIEPPRVIAAMLPGEDGFNDVAAEVSVLLPTPGSWASILSADAIGGSTFHPDETASKPGWVARWSNSFLAAGDTPVEIGVSAAGGTTDVQRAMRTFVVGADAKTKLALASQTQLILQAEYLVNDGRVLADSSSGRAVTETRRGFYAFADMRYRQRYEAGVIYDRFEPRGGGAEEEAIKCFLGYSLLEETTVFRLAYEAYMPGGASTVQTITLQALFSMGPHKAHQF